MIRRADFVRVQALHFRQQLNIHVLPVNMLNIYRQKGWLIFTTDTLGEINESVCMHFKGRYGVFLNARLKDPDLIRWKLAQSAGHIILNHFKEHCLMFYRTETKGEGIIWTLNREAAIFAEEFLMPSGFLKNNQNLGVQNLATVCGVPEAMMESRLASLGLIKNSTENKPWINQVVFKRAGLKLRFTVIVPLLLVAFTCNPKTTLSNLLPKPLRPQMQCSQLNSAL